MRFALQTSMDPFYKTGLALVATSFAIFLLPLLNPTTLGSDPFAVFFANFFLTAGYFIAMVVRRRVKHRVNTIHHRFLLLILFLISAYSLNREMVVFQSSVTWFAATVIVVSANYLLFALFPELPEWIRHLACFVAGVALVVFAYLALYLFPIYAVSLAVFLGLGISLHAFVPLLFCAYTVVLMKQKISEARHYRWSFLAGMVLPVIFVAGYAISWNRNLSAINKEFRYASVTENSQLPAWVSVAQGMHHNAMSKKILKTDIVYTVPHPERDWFWDVPGASGLNYEQKAHDPLIVISALFSGPVYVPVEDRLKILQSLYDARHESEERLWLGKDLVTEQVNTHVELWPSLRVAYTELNVTVTHQPGKTTFTNTQEAIYTFHLPEGGVVTSLSLWIDGQEEKAVLTTKSKASHAYKTIVGVESRDPSVVHWQEGNTVSVRVFPIVKGQSRRFKLGVTAPLALAGQQLRYENIYFDGPSSANASTSVEVSSTEQVNYTDIPKGFAGTAADLLMTGKHYHPDWSLSFTAPALSDKKFFFDHYLYGVRAIDKQQQDFDPATIYLDINRSWSTEELNRIYELVKNKKVYVSTGADRFKAITAGNKNDVFEQLQQRNFSVFPFFHIPDASSSLVISKSAPVSPTIDNLRNSRFLANTQDFFKKNKAVRLYNLGGVLSPYLKSLREFRMLDYEQGDEDRLRRLLVDKKFGRIVENDNEVAVHDAGIFITRDSGNLSGDVPDHVMRLFAYNHILQRSGAAILAETLNEAPLIEEAERAYVVSPFSSLVVLETQEDYDRFDIARSKNSLQNASLGSQGAVPEPHEWLLILIVASLAVLLKFRPQLLPVKNK